MDCISAALRPRPRNDTDGKKDFARPLRHFGDVRGVVVCAPQAPLAGAFPPPNPDHYAKCREPRATLAYWSQRILTFAFAIQYGFVAAARGLYAGSRDCRSLTMPAS